jgi:hypothetical protein
MIPGQCRLAQSLTQLIQAASTYFDQRKHVHFSITSSAQLMAATTVGKPIVLVSAISV